MDIFLFQSAPSKSWSNHQAHPHARFYVQSQKHLKAMKDGTKQTVPTPTMRFTTCQTVCTDLKLDDEYTSLKHKHVLFLLHLVRHGGCQDILRVKTSGVHVARMSARPTPELPRPGSLMWCWRQMICIYLIIYTSGHLYSWYSIRGIYNVFMVYGYLSWLRFF